jgi:tRNA dimethylallyltransferase
MIPPALRHSAWIVAGPTGVGKSELAVELAERCNGEIVGADAFQVYQGLDLLTAKPSAALRARIPHHLIGEIPISETFDVAKYLALADVRLREIRARGRQPLIVGGAGLYIRALTRGLAELPPANAGLRAEFEAEPLAKLQARLRELDPTAALTIDLANPRRVVRALEVCLLTGRPFSSFREQWNETPDHPIGVVLLRDRDDLYARINRRVDEMFAADVVEEVAALRACGPTAAETLGLREIQRYIAGEITQVACAEQIKQATRRYAKRQLTWFRRETSLKPIDLLPESPADSLLQFAGELSAPAESQE